MAVTVVTCPNCGKRNRLLPSAEGVPRCANCHQHLPWVVDAGSEDFEAEVNASIPVLVDMWAAWCAPCRMVTPAIEQIARSYAGQVKVVKLDVDAAPDIAARFDVRGVPTLLLMRDGKEADRMVGAAPPPQIEEWLRPHLPAAAGAR